MDTAELETTYAEAETGYSEDETVYPEGYAGYAGEQTETAGGEAADTAGYQGTELGEGPGETVFANGGGLSVRDSGVWSGATSWRGEGGQVMRFEVKNVNVLGTTITISSSDGQSQSSLILPQGTVTLEFSCFGAEPMGWNFDISSDSDAFIVAWTLYSTWVSGMPANPPR